MDNFHITKDKDQWKFKKEGSSRAIKKTDTKEELVQFSRDYMKGKAGSVKIHKGDGSFQEERTYPRKHDPRKSPG